MKKLITAALATAATLAVCQSVRAETCNNWTNWDLRGTWSVWGGGWKDPSLLSPAFPKGYAPVNYAGIVKLDGQGSGSGSLALNLGGVGVTLQFLTMTYKVRGDCQVDVTYTYELKELGISAGPDTKTFVAAPGTGSSLELHGITLGGGPGTQVEGCTMKRASMQ